MSLQRESEICAILDVSLSMLLAVYSFWHCLCYLMGIQNMNIYLSNTLLFLLADMCFDTLENLFSHDSMCVHEVVGMCIYLKLKMQACRKQLQRTLQKLTP